MSGSTRGGGGDGVAVPAASKPVLRFERVTFGYGRVPVLRDVSLQIFDREFVAIVGANGSGKTTLMRLGLGLLRPSQGTVHLFSVPIEAFRDWGAIGYVPQRAAASSVLPISVEEVVRTGLSGQLGLVRRPRRQDHQRIEQVLDLLGLMAARRRPISQLSGGQQQRTLIARALVTAPRVLILDEPASGIDMAGRSVLKESLEHLVQVEGVTVIYVSHDPQGFVGLADRVLEVRGGRVFDLRASHADHRAAEQSTRTS